MIAVAATAVCAAVPAQAAVTVQINASTTGATTTVRGPCGEKPFCTISTPVSRDFSFTLGVDLALGQSMTFTYGPSTIAGASSGTIMRTGLQTYEGTNFLFTQATPASNGGTETRLSASTFSVRQIFPAPVPEPATWAMMILGFGAIGYAMRRKTVLRFV
ncbi:PEPxxWA-CTERM sorting domain-containing protein [Sphingomonas citri]